MDVLKKPGRRYACVRGGDGEREGEGEGEEHICLHYFITVTEITAVKHLRKTLFQDLGHHSFCRKT